MVDLFLLMYVIFTTEMLKIVIGNSVVLSYVVDLSLEIGCEVSISVELKCVGCTSSLVGNTVPTVLVAIGGVVTVTVVPKGVLGAPVVGAEALEVDI